MSISAAAVVEAPIALPSGTEAVAGTKTPPKRMTVATTDPALVPEPR